MCAATITTGVGPDGHLIPSMNWYHREEGRYVEYGSSFSASRQFGVLRSLTDTVYRMNAEHLSHDVETVFESLDDADVRTAGHDLPDLPRPLPARGVQRDARSPGSSPRRCSGGRSSGRRSCSTPTCTRAARPAAAGSSGCPGSATSTPGCVGAYLVEHDLFDFMLFSLPDNDAWSHKNGPHAQVTSIAAADRQIERLMHAAGGPDAFLDEHAVIVTSDHSQARGRGADPARPRVRGVRRGDAQRRRGRSGAEVALEPGAARGDGLRARRRAPRRAGRRGRSRRSRELEGVDLVMWLPAGSRGGGRPQPPRRAAVRARGIGSSTIAAARWNVEGDLAALRGEVQDGRFLCSEYPDALARIWSALNCPTAGDVLLSAAPGYEFVDWGGADHVGGGSHGSLHRSDSLGALLWCGTGPASRVARERVVAARRRADGARALRD